MKPFVLAALVVFTAGCAATGEVEPAPTFTDADEAAIRELISQWEAAWTAGDLPGVLDLTTDDYFEARANAVEGRDAVLALYETFTITYTSVDATVQRIEGDGDLAFAWMSFENGLTTAEGVERVQTGNTLWALRRGADGAWRFAGAGFSGITRDAPTG